MERTPLSREAATLTIHQLNERLESLQSFLSSRPHPAAGSIPRLPVTPRMISTPSQTEINRERNRNRNQNQNQNRNHDPHRNSNRNLNHQLHSNSNSNLNPTNDVIKPTSNSHSTPPTTHQSQIDFKSNSDSNPNSTVAPSFPHISSLSSSSFPPASTSTPYTASDSVRNDANRPPSSATDGSIPSSNANTSSSSASTAATSSSSSSFSSSSSSNPNSTASLTFPANQVSLSKSPGGSIRVTYEPSSSSSSSSLSSNSVQSPSPFASLPSSTSHNFFSRCVSRTQFPTPTARFRRRSHRTRFGGFSLVKCGDPHEMEGVRAGEMAMVGKRSKVIEIVSAEDVVFALTQTGVCAAFERTQLKRLCFLNVIQDEVIRSLFYNKVNKSIITVSVYRHDNFSSLRCRTTPLPYILLRKPELGSNLFESESLNWPGFVEFDDVNKKVLTYNAIEKIYKVWNLSDYSLLYKIQDSHIEEIKISPGIMLLIYKREKSNVPLSILNIDTGEKLLSFHHLLHKNKKIEFIEQFNEKLLVKQKGAFLQIYDVKTNQVIEVNDQHFVTPTAFIFLYEQQLFLTFLHHQVSVWNFKGELVNRFVDHSLWYPDCNTNNIYINPQQDLIISYCREQSSHTKYLRDHNEENDFDADEECGSINISHILSGECVAKITRMPNVTLKVKKQKRMKRGRDREVRRRKEKRTREMETRDENDREEEEQEEAQEEEKAETRRAEEKGIDTADIFSCETEALSTSARLLSPFSTVPVGSASASPMFTSLVPSPPSSSSTLSSSFSLSPTSSSTPLPTVIERASKRARIHRNTAKSDPIVTMTQSVEKKEENLDTIEVENDNGDGDAERERIQSAAASSSPIMPSASEEEKQEGPTDHLNLSPNSIHMAGTIPSASSTSTSTFEDTGNDGDDDADDDADDGDGAAEDDGDLDDSEIESEFVTAAEVMTENEKRSLTREALFEITALFYNEQRNEIYTGNKRGMVHVWSN